VNRIAQQPDRPGQHGQQQLHQAGDAQADRADRNRAVGLPPLVGVISRPGKPKSRGRITLPEGLVHQARIMTQTTRARRLLSCRPGEHAIWRSCAGAAGRG
jgi:hypothetical protein